MMSEHLPDSSGAYIFVFLAIALMHHCCQGDVQSPSLDAPLLSGGLSEPQP